MTMCMEAGPPRLDKMGRGSTKGQGNPTTSAVFILAASRYAQSNLVSFFFFSTVFFCGLYASFHGRWNKAAFYLVSLQGLWHAF